LEFRFDQPSQIHPSIDNFTPESARFQAGLLHLLAELRDRDAAVVRRLGNGEVVLTCQIGHDVIPHSQRIDLHVAVFRGHELRPVRVTGDFMRTHLALST